MRYDCYAVRLNVFLWFLCSPLMIFHSERSDFVANCILLCSIMNMDATPWIEFNTPLHSATGLPFRYACDAMMLWWQPAIIPEWMHRKIRNSFGMDFEKNTRCFSTVYGRKALSRDHRRWYFPILTLHLSLSYVSYVRMSIQRTERTAADMSCTDSTTISWYSRSFRDRHRYALYATMKFHLCSTL